jgi:hypothetical protein
MLFSFGYRTTDSKLKTQNSKLKTQSRDESDFEVDVGIYPGAIFIASK